MKWIIRRNPQTRLWRLFEPIGQMPCSEHGFHPAYFEHGPFRTWDEAFALVWAETLLDEALEACS